MVVLLKGNWSNRDDSYEHENFIVDFDDEFHATLYHSIMNNHEIILKFSGSILKIKIHNFCSKFVVIHESNITVIVLPRLYSKISEIFNDLYWRNELINSKYLLIFENKDFRFTDFESCNLSKPFPNIKHICLIREE